MSQETIRKLAVVMSLAVRKEVECGSARLLRIQHSLEKELAPFGALLAAAQKVLDIPADDDDCAFDAKKELRAALADVKRGE